MNAQIQSTSLARRVRNFGIGIAATMAVMQLLLYLFVSHFKKDADVAISIVIAVGWLVAGAILSFLGWAAVRWSSADSESEQRQWIGGRLWGVAVGGGIAFIAMLAKGRIGTMAQD